MKLHTFLIMSLLAVSCTRAENNSSSPVQAETLKVSEDSKKMISQYKEPKILEIVPGVSLGDVAIGESDISLKTKGFELDKTFAEPNYMKRGSLLVRLEDQKAIQIFFGDTDTLRADYDRLIFKGKAFPKDQSMKSIKSFFSDCEAASESVHSIGGTLLYCEKRKVRISFGAGGSPRVGLSIILPSDYDQVVTEKKN